MERFPRAIAPCERQRSGLTDMSYAKRVYESLERNLTPLLDGFKQVSNRGFAVALLLLELDLLVTVDKRKDVGRFLDPFFLEEQLDLLFTQPFDIESAACSLNLQVPEFLK